MPSNPSATVVRLHPTDGFDWSTLRSYLASRAIPGLEHVEETRYTRCVIVHGQPVLIELHFTHADGLALVVHDTRRERVEAIASLARRALSLDASDNGDEARQLLGNDTYLAPLVAARPALRVPGTWDGFETGVRAIVGQQVSVSGATTITSRIVHRHGAALGPNESNGTAIATITRCFPRPETLGDGDLAGLGLTHARMATIRGFAHAVADGAVRLDTHLPLDEFVSSITERPGLGPWTAHYLAIRLGYRDAFPAGDLALRRAIDPSNPPSMPELARRAEQWRPWRALAAAHLWTADAQRATEVRPRGHEPTGPREPRPA